MAYVDQDGLIMIDEVEASEDIKKLKSALVVMEDALNILNNIVNINGAFKGDTAIAIDTASAELIKKVNEQKTGIENTIEQINSLINKYRAIDMNIKNRIQN